LHHVFHPGFHKPPYTRIQSVCHILYTQSCPNVQCLPSTGLVYQHVGSVRNCWWVGSKIPICFALKKLMRKEYQL